MQFSHGRGGDRHHTTRQGCYDQTPYIWHQGDDRGGGTSSGETILVNPNGASLIKRIVVYTFIYEGVAKWSETNAVVKIKVPGSEDVVVEMGQQSSNKRFCAIAQLDFGTDNSITVKNSSLSMMVIVTVTRYMAGDLTIHLAVKTNLKPNDMAIRLEKDSA